MGGWGWGGVSEVGKRKNGWRESEVGGDMGQRGRGKKETVSEKGG